MYPVLSPFIRVAWYNTLEAHTVIGPRDIFDYEILYLKEGKVEIIVDDRVYIGKPGDVFIFRPGQRHKITCLNDYPVIQPHIHFDLEYYENRDTVFVSYITKEEMND